MARTNRRSKQPTQPSAAMARYSDEFRREVLPHLAASVMLVQILDPDGLDIQAATEIGCGLLLGKPLLVVAMPGATVPPGLARAADEVVLDYDPKDAEAEQRFMAAIGRLQAELR